jgi:NAD(P)-dependent dehydrogenase (short-subunit alcohol dehydrogenase family)
MANKGYTVFGGVRQEKDAERIKSFNSSIVPVMLDITHPESIREAAAFIHRHLGEVPLLGLVNNTGIVVGGPVEFLPLDALRQQLEVNLFGHVAVIQAFLPLLRKSHGRIVNMGSIAGLTALPFVSPYSISKFSLEALSDALRLELRPWGINVSIIEPGSIATPLWDKSLERAEAMGSEASPELFELYGDALDKIRDASLDSARRGIPAERVADAVVHALTARNPRSRYLVGPDARLRKLFSVLPDGIKDRLIAMTGSSR